MFPFPQCISPLQIVNKLQYFPSHLKNKETLTKKKNTNTNIKIYTKIYVIKYVYRREKYIILDRIWDSQTNWVNRRTKPSPKETNKIYHQNKQEG